MFLKKIKNYLYHFFLLIYLFIKQLKNIFYIVKKENRLIYNAKNMNQDKKIHILGNGPSLGETINKIEKKDEIVMVNFSPLTPLFINLKPKYFVLADPVFFRKNNNNNIDIKVNETLRIIESIEWKLNIIIPHNMNMVINNKNINIIKVLNLSFEDCPKIRNWLYKKNLASPTFQNVIVLAIYSILNLGYRKIYLHGVEANAYKKIYINKDCDAICVAEHYYSTEERNLNKEGLIKSGEVYKYIYYFSVMLRNYNILKQYADCLNANIKNYTINSMIDAFEKDY